MQEARLPILKLLPFKLWAERPYSTICYRLLVISGELRARLGRYGRSESAMRARARNFSYLPMALLSFLENWPLWRQVRHRADGTGTESMSPKTRALQARVQDAEVSRSICPYCGVGCGQLVYHRGGKLLSIEGDPQSPISQGNLCPKGSASFQLLTHPDRLMKVRYRAPHAPAWTDLDLDTAVEMIADRVWESRRRTWIDTDQFGNRVNHTTGIAHLGGATLDNEENYLIKKLFTAGLGMVCVSNQARI
jgi:formate dehydrogenase major subunit